MSATEPDFELVSAYVLQGSENAFRALVLRHLNLVYATAVRQVGDAATAEEITQNVFLTLARKAPRLGRMETLAGWLHRTAILESKARVRADLRRKRREEIAAEQIQPSDSNASGLEPLIPLLDEALLHLRETDRLALMLRYFEDLSLRDVGRVLDVEEDTARKRVSRALDRVTEFFRQRGFALSGVGGAAALMAGSTKAAPTVVAGPILRAASAVALPTGFQIGLFQLFSLTKLQTTALCVVTAAIPLTLQFQAAGRVDAAMNSLEARLAAAKESLLGAESANAELREELRRLEQADLQAGQRRETMGAQIAGQVPVPEYQWDDSSLYARVPKWLARSLGFPAVANRRGLLTDQIKEVLQMTPAEAEEVQGSMDRFLSAYHSLVAARLKQVEPDDEDRGWHRGRELRVFEVGDNSSEFLEIRSVLFQEIESRLGGERAEWFRERLSNWMPIGDDFRGMGSSIAIVPGEHRLRFAPMDDSDEHLALSISRPAGKGRTGVSTSMAFEEIPDFLRPMLQDWISAALERRKGGSR